MSISFVIDHQKAIVILFITPILRSLMTLTIWLALISAIYSRIAPFFALIRIFFQENEKTFTKTKQPIRFQGLCKVTNQTAQKWKNFNNFYELPQDWINKYSCRLKNSAYERLHFAIPKWI